MSENGNGNGHPSLNGRNGRGQFVKGHPGGPGNPLGAELAKWKMRFMRCGTEQDVDDVYQAMLTAAKAGDVAAMKLWMAYKVGKAPDYEMPDMPASATLDPAKTTPERLMLFLEIRKEMAS